MTVAAGNDRFVSPLRPMPVSRTPRIAESVARSVVLRTPIALVEDLRVDGPRATAPRAESYSPEYQVSLPYHGLCIWHVGRDDVAADPNRVKFITADEGYRVSRPIDGGHGELLVTTSAAAVGELLGVPERCLPRHELFRRRSRPSDATLQHMTAEGRFMFERATHNELAAEEWVLALLSRALIVNRLPDATPATTRILSRAKEFLAAHLASRVRLMDVASAAGASPVYVTTLFRRFEGASVHRYLVRLRLARALVEVPHASDLTRLAHDLGFSHHSHFSSAFGRAFGCTPSAFREATRRHRPAMPGAMARSGRASNRARCENPA
jgi:AraC family transcriptional regulator